MGKSRRYRRKKIIPLTRVDWLFWLTPLFIIAPIGICAWYALSVGLPKIMRLIDQLVKMVIV